MKDAPINHAKDKIFTKAHILVIGVTSHTIHTQNRYSKYLTWIP